MSSVAKRTRSHSKTDHPAKRLKLDIEKTENALTTILDLNEDCLAKVFLYLSQQDLINVRLTNSGFRYASERAFTRNYAKSQTSVSMVLDNRYNADVVEDSVRLLQAFGHLITKLLVKFKLENIGKLLESIDEYCGESIIELELCHFGVSVNQQHLYDRGLEEMKEFLDGGLHKRFPKLHHLKVEYRSTSERCLYLKRLARPIPSLKSFSVAGALFALDDIREFLSVNAQLESLTIIGQPNGISTPRLLSITEEFINSVDAALPQLKNIEIYHVAIKHLQNRINPTNGFRNLKTLTIGDLVDFQFVYDYPCLCLFAGKNIEEICTYVFIHYVTDNFATKFKRFQTLKRLVFHWLISDHLTNGQSRQLMEQLRIIVSDNNQLTDIVIQLYYWDENYKKIPHVNSPHFDSIKSVFDKAQWSLNEDVNGLAFSKHRQN